MALNIKNSEVERLAEAVASMTGETKTQAIRKALEERKERLAFQVVPRDRTATLMEFLEREIWPLAPSGQLGKKLDKKTREELLGYGPKGV